MRVKTFGLTLLALMAVGAISAAGATAHAWKHSSHTELVSPEKFIAIGAITFDDTHHGNSYSCTIREEGTVGRGAVGQITSITGEYPKKAITCNRQSGSEPCGNGEIVVEAVHLPWATELATIGGSLRNEIKLGSPPSQAEWAITCKGWIGGTFSERCLANTYTGVQNLSNGEVETFFSKGEFQSPSLECYGSYVHLPLKGGVTIRGLEGGLEAT